MASILDRYGIKEVADLTFYSIDASTGRPRTPVLYIDTAKVSTIESTAETTYAEGGRGNGRLIAWDFGKEITLSIEDAVFSPKSLAIMFGEGRIDKQDADIDITAKEGNLYRTLIFNVADLTDVGTGVTLNADAVDDKANSLIKNALGQKVKGADDGDFKVTYTAAESEPGSNVAQLTFNAASGQEGQEGYKPAGFYYATGGAEYTDAKVFVSFYVTPEHAYQINVGPDSFPGTYYITADTYVRSEGDGEDRFFQIIIPKGKVTSENTLTMEADGDPTVFNMNVDVLRATVGGVNIMMQLVQYDFDDDAAGGEESIILDTRIAVQ